MIVGLPQVELDWPLYEPQADPKEGGTVRTES